MNELNVIEESDEIDQNPDSLQKQPSFSNKPKRDYTNFIKNQEKDIDQEIQYYQDKIDKLKQDKIDKLNLERTKNQMPSTGHYKWMDNTNYIMPNAKPLESLKVDIVPTSKRESKQKIENESISDENGSNSQFSRDEASEKPDITQSEVVKEAQERKILQFDMLNPVMPPSIQINKVTNDWAIQRLNTVLPSYVPVKAKLNKKGKYYIEFYPKSDYEKQEVSMNYLMLGICFCLFGLVYEGCGVCWILRDLYLKELNIIPFDDIEIKSTSLQILRINFSLEEKNKMVKFSKMKQLVEISIKTMESSTEFESALVDQLKGSKKLRKITLDIPKIMNSRLSNVIGYLENLESLNINLENQFNFDHMNQTLPKLKELSLWDQSPNSLKSNSSLLKQLLILRIRTVDLEKGFLDILQNINQNSIPLRHLSLIFKYEKSPNFQKYIDEIKYIQSLQFLELQLEQKSSSIHTLDVSALKNLTDLSLMNFNGFLFGLQSCMNFKKLAATEKVNITEFSLCNANSLQNLQEVEVMADEENLKSLGQGLQYAYNLQALKTYFLSDQTVDTHLDELLKALQSTSKLKAISLQARYLDISDNALIKLSNSLFHKESQLQMFELLSNRLPSITGQSFELLFQQAAKVCKNFIIFNLDVKNNDNIAEQSIKEVLSSVSKIKSNAKIMNISILNLGRVNEETVKKIQISKSTKFQSFKGIHPYVKDIILMDQGTDDELTVFDKYFRY